MILAEAPSMVITPDSFDPPLKRTEATVPGYWTVEELAEEVGINIRNVQYFITGDAKKNIPSRLRAYKVGPAYLVSDADALDYLWKKRQSKKKS